MHVEEAEAGYKEETTWRGGWRLQAGGSPLEPPQLTGRESGRSEWGRARMPAAPSCWRHVILLENSCVLLREYLMVASAQQDFFQVACWESGLGWGRFLVLTTSSSSRAPLLTFPDAFSSLCHYFLCSGSCPAHRCMLGQVVSYVCYCFLALLCFIFFPLLSVEMTSQGS